MSQLVDKLVSNLSDNPYFGAGAGLVGLGTALAIGRQGFSLGLILFKRHCMMTLEITHRDRSYPWVLNWLTHHHRRAQHLSVVTQIKQRESGTFSSNFNFVPSVGTHFFRFNDRWIKVERDRQQTAVDLNMGLPFETIKFTCLGSDKQIFSDMLGYAKDLEISKHDGKTAIYEPRTNDWEPFGEPRAQRKFDSVILEQGIAEKISSDVDEFLKSREWYAERGVPYHRGYLLHGPPGCGKTSFIIALAGRLGYDICQMNLSNPALSDDRLAYLMNVAPPNSIILLEDVDAVLRSRDDSETSPYAYQGMRRITWSGILNVLDGVASSEGRILFMTTNYPERLDPALTRPGRVDMKIYIGYATDQQLARAFEKFYPPDKTSGPDGLDFVKAINQLRRESKNRKLIQLSMADVQSHFLCHKDKPDDAIAKLSNIFDAKENEFNSGNRSSRNKGI